MSSPDSKLLGRWTRFHDAEAFNELVSRYASFVFATSKRILQNAADAEDVTQECFLCLAQTDLSKLQTLGGWLHTVATRRSLSLLKRDERRRRREEKFGNLPRERSDSGWEEIAECIDEAIAALPPELRTVVVGHFLARRSHAEIARELGISRRAVSYRCQQGIDRIRSFLKTRGMLAGAASLTSFLGSQAVEAAPAALIASLARIAISGRGPSATAASPSRGARTMSPIRVALLALSIGVVATVGYLWHAASDDAVAPARDPGRGGAPNRDPPPEISPAEPRGPRETAVPAAIPAPAAADKETPGGSPRIAGRVLSEARGPVANAQVILFHAMKNWGLGDEVVEETQSAEDGAYSLAASAVFEKTKKHSYAQDEFLVFALHPGHALAWRSILQGEERRELDLVMSLPVTRTVTVVDIDGRPLTGARVWMYAAGDSQDANRLFRRQFYVYSDLDLAWGTTDVNGEALITNLPDTKLSFWASLPGYADGICFSCSKITLTRGGTLAGRVLDEAGAPVAGVVVSFAQGSMHSFFKTETDGEGRFRLEDLPARGWDMSAWGRENRGTGQFRITMESETCIAEEIQASLEPGEVKDDLAIVARKGTRVQCLVIDGRTEEPVAGARVSGRNARGRFGGYTDDSGRLEIVVLPGKTMMHFHSPPSGVYIEGNSLNYPGSSVDFDAQGDEVSVTLKSPPVRGRLKTVVGRIENISAILGAKVQVHGSGGEIQTAEGGGFAQTPVDPEGTFELKKVPEGRSIHLYAETEDRRWAAAGTFAIAGTPAAGMETDPAADDDVSLRLVPTREVRRELQRPDGSTLAGARFTVRPVVGGEAVIWSKSRKTTTNAEGQVEIDGILSGLEYFIWENDPNEWPDGGTRLLADGNRVDGKREDAQIRLVLLPAE